MVWDRSEPGPAPYGLKGADKGPQAKIPSSFEQIPVPFRQNCQNCQKIMTFWRILKLTFGKFWPRRVKARSGTCVRYRPKLTHLANTLHLRTAT